MTATIWARPLILPSGVCYNCNAPSTTSISVRSEGGIASSVGAGHGLLVAAVAAAASGEEFELLVTLSAEFKDAATFVKATGLPLTRIGTCGAGSGTRITSNQQLVTIPGFQHFA